MIDVLLQWRQITVGVPIGGAGGDAPAACAVRPAPAALRKPAQRGGSKSNGAAEVGDSQPLCDGEHVVPLDQDEGVNRAGT